MTSLHDVPAPAKLNLFLHVTGRRADGYHLLQTVFTFVDLADRLHFTLRDDGRIVRATDMPGVPHDDDLIVRAARLLQQHAGAQSGAAAGVTIAVDKQIPAGGGLGGGSSDAASTLIALNRLWGCGLSREALQTLGLTLGADVPVFIFGQSAFAQGVGEALQACPVPQVAYVVFVPTISVATATVFAYPDLTRDSKSIIMHDFAGHDIHQFGRNDLQAAACALFKPLSLIVGWLESLGLQARMTGSGACFFVPFDTADQAQACKH
ncbi:MAG TPA: 4-(cytidine 5'-diphospho)-2-C-methyl-D-erythritol kinase, partial [Advenella sp.]|nr:4-(cytidine 5'-diphospho)-2-C-methyl-D-erythritol kinase [Advenella sp.]